MTLFNRYLFRLFLICSSLLLGNCHNQDSGLQRQKVASSITIDYCNPFTIIVDVQDVTTYFSNNKEAKIYIMTKKKQQSFEKNRAYDVVSKLFNNLEAQNVKFEEVTTDLSGKLYQGSCTSFTDKLQLGKEINFLIRSDFDSVMGNMVIVFTRNTSKGKKHARKIIRSVKIHNKEHLF